MDRGTCDIDIADMLRATLASADVHDPFDRSTVQLKMARPARYGRAQRNDFLGMKAVTVVHQNQVDAWKLLSEGDDDFLPPRGQSR